MRSDAPLIHEGLDGVEGNVCWRQATRAGDINTALAEADLVISRRLVTSKAHAMPMETHAAVARYDDLSGAITLWTGTQQPHLLRNEIARVFGYLQSKVRVIKPYMGGAFGHKEGLHTNEAMAIWAARALRRPVRIELSRTEEFAATVSRNPHIRDATIAVSSDGKILGWKETITQDVGAYTNISPAVLALSEWVTVGPYKTPALDIEGAVVYTNKPPSGAFRGFGNPQATLRPRSHVRHRRPRTGDRPTGVPLQEPHPVRGPTDLHCQRPEAPHATDRGGDRCGSRGNRIRSDAGFETALEGRGHSEHARMGWWMPLACELRRGYVIGNSRYERRR